MLKHCSGSSLDIRGRNTPEHSRLENREYRKLRIWNKLENQRLSVSLLYLDKDQTDLHNVKKGPKSISLSSKYSQIRSRIHSVSDSYHMSIHRGFESIRVYAKCLRSDIEYRTVRIDSSTTAKMLIQGLLTKFKLKHVDPKLFYLTMDVTIEAIKQTVIKISDDDKLARLLLCNPWSDSKITLRSKAGGFIKVYDNVIMTDSVYKSIRVSFETTVGEVIHIVIGCCNSDLPTEDFCLIESGDEISRLMRLEERPLMLCKSWGVISNNKFVIERVEFKDEVTFDSADEKFDGDELATCGPSASSSYDLEETSYNQERYQNQGSSEDSSLGSQESLDSGYWAHLS